MKLALALLRMFSSQIVVISLSLSSFAQLSIPPRKGSLDLLKPLTFGSGVQGTRTAPSALDQHGGSKNMKMRRVLAATYYSLKDGVDTSLTLSNQGPNPMQVNVLLFDMKGKNLEVPTLTIPANVAQTFDLSRWVAAAGRSFEEGSLQVAYDGMYLELAGVIKITDLLHSLAFDEELVEPDRAFASSRLEGVWWLHSEDSQLRVALTNTTDSSLTATIAFTQKDARWFQPRILKLHAHETRTLEGPELRNDSANLNRNDDALLDEVGGISIRYSGRFGSVLARGYIQEPTRGFSNSIEFSDPEAQKSGVLDGVGLRIGRFAGEHLAQVAIARNVGTLPTVLSGSIQCVRPDGSSARIALPGLTLNSGDVRKIDLADAIDGAGLGEVHAATIEITSSRGASTMIASALSFTEDGNQVFRVPMVNAASLQSSTGTYPWMIDNSSSTFVYLTNVTDRKQQYKMYIYYDGGSYVFGMKTLGPRETIMVNIRSLRETGASDSRGNKLPREASEGQVYWSFSGPADRGIVGRVEQVDAVHGTTITASCGQCCGANFDYALQTPGSVVGFVGGTTAFTTTAHDRSCYGQDLGPYYITWGTWSTSDESVATCDQGGTATAVGPGSTQVFQNWDVWDNVEDETGIYCIQQQRTVGAAANCDVKPSISGPNTVWWFAGQTGSGVLATSITLQSNGGNGTVWNVTSGSEKVTINATGSTLTVSSSGAAFSGSVGDVQIVATVNGETSSPFGITTRKPYKLVPAGTSAECSGQYGYFDILHYTVLDQMLIPLPADVNYNEKWTTAITPVVSNNWQRPSETPGTTLGSDLADIITGPGDPNASPTPVCAGGNSTEVQYWGQEWRIGTQLTGSGQRVQTDTFVRFVNHAEHQAILSPAP